MKFFLLFSSILFLNTYAKEITPLYQLHTSGYVTDYVLDGDKIYVATDAGSVDIFTLGSEKMIGQILLEPITSGRGEKMDTYITRVDRRNGKTLIVSRAKGNYRDVWIEEGGRVTKIIDTSKKLLVRDAKFADDNRIVFATFDADVILYNISEGYKVYSKSNAQSTLTSMAITNNEIVVADESGVLTLYDLEEGSVSARFEGQNVDKVYSVAYENGVLLTGGEDRRVAVYQKEQKPYYLKSSFLVYSVGLSPSGERGVYSSGEEQVLQLFNTKTKRKGDQLIGHKEIVKKILFISENSLISSGEQNELFFWKID